jgi:hypothetical protein
MKITISAGNSKTGKIPSVSLPPGITCTPAARRTCYQQGCYAVKLCRIYPAVKTSYANNLEAYQADPAAYFQFIADYLTRTAPKYFRWHISGDIPDAGYYQGMLAIALQFPKVRFLAFTKRKVAPSIADNLSIVCSQWPGLPVNAGAAMAWMFDPKNPDPRIPADARPCPGRCDTCGACWSLSGHIVFDKH